MTYKDMTFCSGGGCTKFDGCNRALTNKVQQNADKAGNLIAEVLDPRQMPCHSDKQLKSDYEKSL